MYKSILVIAAGLVLLSACSEQNETEQAKAEPVADETTTAPSETSPASAMSDADKRAYALGANSAGFLTRSFPEFDNWGMSVDKNLVKKGFNDMLEGKAEMSSEEMQAVLMAFQQEIQTKIAEVEAQQQEQSMAANQTFLEQHAGQESVQITESGLQYRILSEGTGPKPTADDVVRVHYRGTLIDGTEFDSSYGRGEPIDFPVSRVIPGWAEGIQLVKEGGKIELVMGPELGYGDRATGSIPPNSALKFEVELLKVNPEPEAKEVIQEEPGKN